jgi:hypothetical protein
MHDGCLRCCRSASGSTAWSFIRRRHDSSTSDGPTVCRPATTTTRSTPEVSVKSADVSGKVLLAAKAVAPGAVYVWEYSVDQSKWTALPEIMRSRTELSGLTPACTYYFRFRALTRAGWQNYSNVVSLIVR